MHARLYPRLLLLFVPLLALAFLRMPLRPLVAQPPLVAASRGARRAGKSGASGTQSGPEARDFSRGPGPVTTGACSRGSEAVEEVVEHPRGELQARHRHPLVHAVEQRGEIEIGGQPERREPVRRHAELVPSLGVGAAFGIKNWRNARHGADGVAATADMLPEVVDAVAGRLEVLVDGGIRRGTDVLVALGLGASAVLVGRPALWGLAAGGEAGARAVLDTLQREVENGLALLGCRSPRDVTGQHVAPGIPRA